LSISTLSTSSAGSCISALELPNNLNVAESGSIGFHFCFATKSEIAFFMDPIVIGQLCRITVTRSGIESWPNNSGCPLSPRTICSLINIRALLSCGLRPSSIISAVSRISAGVSGGKLMGVSLGVNYKF